MYKITDWTAWADSRRELWLDCIRVYLGLGLFARGLLLITNRPPAYFVDMLTASGQSWLLIGSLLHYVVLAHFVGGALLAVGLFTRLAALMQIPILAGAVFLVHRHEGLLTAGQSLEFSALVLFMLVMILLAGPGRFSVDHVIFGSRSDPVEPLPEAMKS